MLHVSIFFLPDLYWPPLCREPLSAFFLRPLGFHLDLRSFSKEYLSARASGILHFLLNNEFSESSLFAACMGMYSIFRILCDLYSLRQPYDLSGEAKRKKLSGSSTVFSGLLSI